MLNSTSWTNIPTAGKVQPNVFRYKKIGSLYLFHIRFESQVFDGNIGEQLFTFSNAPTIVLYNIGNPIRVPISIDMSYPTTGRATFGLNIFYAGEVTGYPRLENAMTGIVAGNLFGDVFFYGVG